MRLLCVALISAALFSCGGSSNTDSGNCSVVLTGGKQGGTFTHCVVGPSGCPGGSSTDCVTVTFGDLNGGSSGDSAYIVIPTQPGTYSCSSGATTAGYQADGDDFAYIAVCDAQSGCTNGSSCTVTVQEVSLANNHFNGSVDATGVQSSGGNATQHFALSGSF